MSDLINGALNSTATLAPVNAPISELEAELLRLRAENAALKARKSATLSFKVAEKGGVSVYGLGQFPVTLYVEQWDKVFAVTDQIRAFAETHKDEIATKSAISKAAREAAKAAAKK